MTKMDRAAFERTIYSNWAERFGCTIDTLQKPGTDLIPEERFAGSGGIHVWHIGAHAFARFDPSALEIVKEALAHSPESTSLGSDQVKAVVGSGGIRAEEQGLLLYLYPPDFRPPAPPSALKIRELTLEDVEALATMKEACTPMEVELGEVSVEDEIGFGCFDGKALVAVATGYRLTGFMDIGVLTHPAYRHRGLGKAVVSALTAWCIQKPILAQYRCLDTNIGSHKIALGLGFREYFRQQSIYLTRQGAS